ncbi:thiaminase II [Thermomicrobium roseum]|uniref:Aminopyrimidine aminohydrolase n=1 Tax=Thermomicrobium roseum (strain ATCC 27502 / DSM 5159 / P-2) TaxID=309801 RepID=B9KYJ3_THERP|nr:thiaminase II [Thermomicrobium roseum]ACM06178.1 TENA/THI-4 family [Thermomicrobium roseum DSM 5159]
MTSFTQELWRSIDPIYQAIVVHPFLVGLTDGTLPEEAFRFYVVQDALYLQDYARCLALAAAKAPRETWCELFADHAKVALVVERALHESFFAAWGLSPDKIAGTPYAPTNLAYTSYLLRVAYERPFEEVIGALLPCYWIYWEVGKHLERSGSPNPLYQKWIDTYASEEYAAVVQAVLDVADQVVTDLPESRRQPIRTHFVTTARYEWMFWDAAWRLERWPV